MPESGKLIIALGALIVILCLIKMIRSGHFFKTFAVSSASGIGSLFALNLISFITGLKLSINWFTLIFCSFTGISGSICLLLINTIKNLS
ncbi:MAG: pro-sigmaK processing inhibitor BofA family protein [Acutalibacteraceae bacterium]